MQTQGTSMGGRYAPPYANLFMARIEEIILNHWPTYILLWKRFIDDIFFIFLGSFQELHALQAFMNDLHPTIKFTFEVSTTDIPFLDTRVMINENRSIITGLYKKPTDRSFLLHFYSNHPLSTKESIIYSQALRYNMIISNDNTLQLELDNLTRTLLARKYPLEVIIKNITKALIHSQLDLIHKPPKDTNTPSNNLPLITKYTPEGLHLCRSIHHNWHTLEEDPDIHNIFPERPVSAFKRNKTIGNILVRSDTT